MYQRINIKCFISIGIHICVPISNLVQNLSVQVKINAKLSKIVVVTNNFWHVMMNGERCRLVTLFRPIKHSPTNPRYLYRGVATKSKCVSHNEQYVALARVWEWLSREVTILSPPMPSDGWQIFN